MKLRIKWNNETNKFYLYRTIQPYNMNCFVLYNMNCFILFNNMVYLYDLKSLLKVVKFVK